MIDPRRELELRATRLPVPYREAFVDVLRARYRLSDAPWGTQAFALVFSSNEDIKAALDFIGTPKEAGGGV